MVSAPDQTLNDKITALIMKEMERQGKKASTISMEFKQILKWQAGNGYGYTHNYS